MLAGDDDAADGGEFEVPFDFLFFGRFSDDEVDAGVGGDAAAGGCDEDFVAAGFDIYVELAGGAGSDALGLEVGLGWD